MSGSLVLFPLRLGLRATGLAARGARELVERAAGLAGLAPDRSHERAPSPDFDAAPTAAPTRTEPPARPTQTQTADAPPPLHEGGAVALHEGGAVDYDAPEEPEPVHVDEGLELVEETAEPGAEDGAGAQVRVAEPWNGYAALRAADVIERVAQATSEELAAIELYELTSRRRQTVIAAAQDELARRR